MRFSSLVERVAGRGSGAWAVHHEAVRRRAEGQDVVLLTVGDPDLPPPPAVLAAAADAIGRRQTGYSPIVGYPEVRAAIAERHARRAGVPCTADNVVVVPGAQAGLYCAMQCLAGPGDEVLAMEPLYATYQAVAGAAGATLATVPLRPERGFHPDLDELERAVTPRTRVLWVNSPHNPTGAVLDRGEMERICDIARRHDLWVLSDEVYQDLAYARPHLGPGALPGMAERTVTVSSISKSHALPGFRFGWIVGPAELARHLFNLMLCMLYGGPPFVQRAAIVALGNEFPEVEAMREAYLRRARLFVRAVSRAPGCRAAEPEGGMFVLLDVRGTGLGAEAFARRLLDREGVATLPADAFGPSAEGHLRVSLAAEDAVLADAAERIVRTAETLAREG
jgi:arginine:pyruvate transaminase